MPDDGGHGLALDAARRLVEAHHGTPTVESACGKGAVFIAILPVDSEGLRALIELTEDKR
ncbi:MAG: ATP-binding protein [Chloroflexi bacterium]|nr:ATP-binding protein [Chloroflexota bacterium]